MNEGSSKPRFIVDTMHGDLAKWLRILGYDTVYSRSYTDRQLLELALLGDRVLVTKDKRLYAKAKKLGVRGVLVESTLTVEKIAELASKIKLDLNVDPSRSRCPDCNGVLVKRGREEVRSRVPPRVLEVYEEFYECAKCGKVYWEGSHWRNIRGVIEEARSFAQSFRKALRISSRKRAGGEASVARVEAREDGENLAQNTGSSSQA